MSSGKDGWRKIAKDGDLGKSIEKTLASNYVCVYVDTATDPGKRLASALSLDGGKGIVISDASGQLMAFFHEGDLANKDMAWYLNRFADPDRVVQATETNPPAYRSYYPPQAPVPVYNFGGGGGRSC